MNTSDTSNLKEIRKAVIISACLLFFITFLFYAPSIFFDFVHWDDAAEITQDPIVTEFSWNKFRENSFSSQKNLQFSPVHLLLNVFSWKVGAGSPVPFHFLNVVFHAANAALLFLFFFKCQTFFLKNSTRPMVAIAFFASILWSVNPLRVEPVCWISARTHILALFFLLCSAVLLLDETLSNRKIILSLIFYIFSLFSYPTAITVPLLLFLFYRKRWNLYFFVSSLSIAFLTLILQKIKLENLEAPSSGILDRVFSFPAFLFLYIEKTFFPHDLAPIYFSVQRGSLVDIFFGIAWVALLTIIACTFYFKKRAGIIFLCFLSYLILALPILGNRYRVPMPHDRYFYLPSLPLFFLLAFLIHKISSRVKRNMAYFSLLSLFIIFSQKQIAIWKNTEALFEHLLPRASTQKAMHEYIQQELDQIKKDK